MLALRLFCFATSCLSAILWVGCLLGLVLVEVESFPVKKEGGNGQAGFSLRGFGARSPKFSLGFNEMILM